MLTIKEVSEKLGITPQAIYQKIDKQLNKELKPFVKEIKRGSRSVKMIESEGVEIIRNSLEQAVEQEVEEISTTIDNELIAILKDTIDVLRGQLDVKDLQIRELNERLKEAQQLNQNSQVLLKNTQEVKMIEESSWWDRVKVKFK